MARGASDLEDDRLNPRLRTPVGVPCAVAVLAFLLGGCFRSHGSNPPLVDATATANPEEAHGLVEFQKELARYVTLRDRVMRETPAGHAGARKPEASPGALATEIRRQRRGAKQTSRTATSSWS